MLLEFSGNKEISFSTPLFSPFLTPNTVCGHGTLLLQEVPPPSHIPLLFLVRTSCFPSLQGGELRWGYGQLVGSWPHWCSQKGNLVNTPSTEPSQKRKGEVPVFRKPPPGGSGKGDRPQKLQTPGSWARGWAGVLCGALQSDSHEQSGGE